MIRYNPMTDVKYDFPGLIELTEEGHDIDQELPELLKDATLEGFHTFINGADGIIFIFRRPDGKELLLDCSPGASMAIFYAVIDQ